MDIPCYKKMMLDFYSAYEPFPEQRISFAKKKGWYISYTDDSSKLQLSLYRLPGKRKYEPLHFRKRAITLNEDEIRNLDEYKASMDQHFNLERCAYFGYD